MAAPVELVPLRCLRCETPVPAQVEEVAWVCAQCGQGLLLDESAGLVELEVHYASGLAEGKTGRPFWVADGRVRLERETYGGFSKGGAGEAEGFWGQARRFYIPAYACSLDELLEAGARFLRQPPPLEPGPAVKFLPAILSPEDLQALAEFIVVAIEAERPDRLKKVDVSVELFRPALWILP